MELGGDRDYRKMILEQAQVYHTPLGERRMRCCWTSSTDCPAACRKGGDLMINGRAMPYRHRAGDLVWFDFEALCGPPRSKNDYIELARTRQTVFISDIPIMGGSRDDRTPASSSWSTSSMTAG